MTGAATGGAKWRSRPTTAWDLEFVQSGSTIQFSYSYAPCKLADLGQGTLDDFIMTDVGQAKLDLRRVRFASGHVYLLNHQQSLLNHAVLFRVEIQQTSSSVESAAKSSEK